MLKTLILITLLISSAFSVPVSIINVPDRNGVSENVEAKIDSMIESLAPYLDNPMNWCEVTPNGISSESLEGSDKVGYVALNVHMDIHCDNSKMMDAMRSVFETGFKIGTKRDKTTGMLWEGDNIIYFGASLRARYKNIEYRFTPSEREIKMFISNSFSGENQGAPVLGKLMLNGKELNDEFILDHRYGNEYTSPNIFRVSVGRNLFVRITLESRDTPNAAQLTADEYMDEHYSCTLIYKVKESTAKKILKQKEIDISVERVYNNPTPGWMNRDIRFLGYRRQ